MKTKQMKKAVAAFATLAANMDYETMDGQPVNVVFALLIPEYATEEHLQTLAQLATLFSDDDLRRRLLNTGSSEEIYDILTSNNSLASRKAG